MASDPKALIATKFLDSLLKEIVLDTALSTHATIKRARSICKLCGTRCQAHTPAAAQVAALGHTNAVDSNAEPRSASGTPAPGSAAASNKPDYYSNNPLFECLVCSRQVSSNRYATHLAKCMGMGSKGGRKGAARNAKVTSTSTPSRVSGTGTPRYGSDLDDDSFIKKKGKNGSNGNKRALSPLSASTVANVRMNKKIKTSSPTPPPSDNIGGMTRSYSSQTFAPSGLSNSTVLSGSPLNPSNNKSNGRAGSESRLHETGSKLKESYPPSKDPSTSRGRGRPSKESLGKNGSPKKRKRHDDDEDDEDDDDEGVESFEDPGSDGSGSEEDFDAESDGDDAEEEGEISDDDVALAVGAGAPKAVGTKIKIPIRSTSVASNNAAIDIRDDSDAEDDDEDDDDDIEMTSIRRGSSPDVPLGGSFAEAGRKKKSGASGGLQRERGSDGEFIDVESASEQSDGDSF